MIKVHFYDYGNSELDIEEELGLKIDVEDFLMANISDLSLEATNFECDLEDNMVLWFSSSNERKVVNDIRKLISSKLKENSTMKYDVQIEEHL